jgi:hypothetical protein
MREAHRGVRCTIRHLCMALHTRRVGGWAARGIGIGEAPCTGRSGCAIRGGARRQDAVLEACSVTPNEFLAARWCSQLLSLAAQYATGLHSRVVQQRLQAAFAYRPSLERLIARSWSRTPPIATRGSAAIREEQLHQTSLLSPAQTNTVKDPASLVRIRRRSGARRVRSWSPRPCPHRTHRGGDPRQRRVELHLRCLPGGGVITF